MKNKQHSSIYIIGAGFAGKEIALEIGRKGILGHVEAFLDDDPAKIGTTIVGIPVFGPISRVAAVLEQRPADEAIIAIPGARQEDLRRIYWTLKRADFRKIRLLPQISQIIEGDAHLIQTREIDPRDLLARNPVLIPLKESLDYLKGQRVLITGAGGSIGSELARQLLTGGTQRLYLFDHDENSIYEIEKELRLLQEEGIGKNAAIVPVIGDLLDSAFVSFILRRLKADVIFHCAAYKHVPMLEMNPVEAIKNNVFGTRNIVRAASEARCRRFVFISTDKAVDPVSIYGAGKKIAEQVVLSGNGGSTEFMVVRFGNVLGSRGSIVPLFEKQILKGGPVTITHPDCTRFFMTIPEAASLVLKAGGVGSGRTLYILEMGEPVPIKELAEQMIRFYGYEPEQEIPVSVIGLRAGEKIHERLWSTDEIPEKTGFAGILKLRGNGRADIDTSILLPRLEPVCFFTPERQEAYRNRRVLRRILKEVIPSLEEQADEPKY